MSSGYPRARAARAPKKLTIVIAGCLVAVAIAATAQAQTFEITPFGGWRFGGGFADLETGGDVSLDDEVSFGVILGIPWNQEHRSRLELVWSRQPTSVILAGFENSEFDLDVDYLHLGGMVPFATAKKKLDTLLSAGVGATFFWPGLSGAGTEVRFSASFGVGLLYHVSDRVGIRLEARGFYTFTETGGAIFCSGGCVVAFSGSGFGQGELTAGLQLAF